MVHRWPTVVVAVPLSLLLQCLVARDTRSLAVARPRRFLVGVPSFVGRGRAAVGRRDDTATVVGYDGLCRPRFEDGEAVPDVDGCERRVGGGGCDNRRGVHYNSAAASQRPRPAPPATVIDQYDVLLTVIVNINEQYEELMRKLPFNYDNQKKFQWTV